MSASNPSAYVVDGEVVVGWSSNQPQWSNDPKWAKLRALHERENASRRDKLNELHTFTVHRGKFKFYFRKSFQGRASMPEDKDPFFSGERYHDPGFIERVSNLKIVL